MRLIDADEINFNEVFVGASEFAQDTRNAAQMLINRQPTAYDVDKVVEQLKTARDGYSTAQLMTATNDELVKRFIAKEKAMNLAIEIVKAGGRGNVNTESKS